MECADLVPYMEADSRFNGAFVFSNDSKFLFCCCGSVVKVYNTINGECIHDLKAHSKAVTGVFLNPSNVLQLYSCGMDGCLIIWDYLDGVKIKLHDLQMPLYGIVHMNPDTKSMMMVAETSYENFDLMQWKKRKEESKTKKNANVFDEPKMIIANCSKRSGLVSFGCMKEYAAAGDGNTLMIYSLKQDEIRKVYDCGSTRPHYREEFPITVVACHPTEYIIATGSTRGVITLWQNFFPGQKPVPSRFAWHPLPVGCITFTPDGSNMLSGGQECVLVRWYMDRMDQREHRDFKTNMGAPITQVLCSPDGSLYATQHSDNSVQLSSIDWISLQTYRGLTRAKAFRGLTQEQDVNGIPVGLNYDPRSQALVTNGLPGHLQFYSLLYNKQLFNLDIVGQNIISGNAEAQLQVITEVTSLAISDTGSWLATFECWDDGQFTPEMKLKFWVWNSSAQTYSLNTTVECPHDESRVTKMIFRPQSTPPSGNSQSMVTLGSDCCFKKWSLVDDTDIYRSNNRWDCESVGFYRSLNAGCADFSFDGTALAIGFEHLITLWDPDNMTVHATLTNNLSNRPAVSNVLFGYKECSKLLVVSTTTNLLVWDLLTLTVKWQINTDISMVIRDPASDLMAFVTSRIEGVRGVSKSLYVGNLNLESNEESICNAFKGSVRAVIPSDQDSGRAKGFAYVEFNSPEAATKAYDAMCGQTLDGHEIKIHFADGFAGKSPGANYEAGERVTIFRPNSPEMIYENSKISIGSKILGAIFIPDSRNSDIVDLGWPGKSQLYIFNEEEELITLDLPRIQTSNKVQIAQILPQSALKAFFAEKSVREKDNEQTKVFKNDKTKTNDELIASLLHSNEPVSMQCDQFLKTLLKKRSKQHPRSEHKDENEDSSDSDTEDANAAVNHTDKLKMLPVDETNKESIEEENMDRLLSRPLDWIEWAADLTFE